MNKYEAMFIVKPDLSEEDKKTLLGQVNDVINKNNGHITNSSVWAEKKKLYFKIKKYQEGTYYLVDFSLGSSGIKEIMHAYGLNENILRVLITRIE